jgi:hypothetical protein
MEDILLGEGENHCSSSLEPNWQDSGLNNITNPDSYKMAVLRAKSIIEPNTWL